jgi:protein translocase SecG subunit
MQKTINILEIVISIFLIISILLQSRGAGIGGTFGDSFGSYHTKRGFEKFLSIFSVILAILFVILALTNLFLARQ